MIKKPLAALPMLLLLGACTSTPDKLVPEDDKWEALNRKTFAFNEGLDNTLVKPTVKAYKAVTPDIAEKGINNFFANLADLSNAANNFLQFKPAKAGNDLTRFAFNSTFGIFGFIDVASELKMEKHNEDFGQTLATWGVAPGPYLVLPAFGPSTLRDAGGRLVDTKFDATNHADDYDMDAVKPLQLLNTRNEVLKIENNIPNVSNDRYAMIRDIWLKDRAYLISDGKISRTDDNDLASELEALE